MAQPQYPGYPPIDKQPGSEGQPGGYPPPGSYPPPGIYPPPDGQPGYPPPGGYPPAYNNPAYGGPPVPPGPQPGVAEWMPKPDVSGCPPGLEYLTQIDQLLVHQTVELLEAFTGFETQNRFQVKNSVGQQVYYAGEESGCCTRQCCGAHRGFLMHMTDNMGNEVLRAQREFKCCAGCCWFACADCGAYELTVEAPVGTVIGYVRQSCSFWYPKFVIMDADRQPLMRLEGPCCICECPCFDVDFKLYSLDGEEVGKVNKQWTGFVKEIFTQADNFGISFPMDLDVKVKAILVGAVFLINMMYFENKNNDNNN